MTSFKSYFKLITLLFVINFTSSAFGSQMSCGWKNVPSEGGGTEWVYGCTISGGGGGGSSDPNSTTYDGINWNDPFVGMDGYGSGSTTSAAPSSEVQKEKCKNTADAKYQMCELRASLAGEKMYTACWDEGGVPMQVWHEVLNKFGLLAKMERKCKLEQKTMQTAASGECLKIRVSDLNTICLAIP